MEENRGRLSNPTKYMKKKASIALVQIPSAVPGRRRYLAVHKDGRVDAWGVQVIDAGQGAAQALELAREKFNVSNAAWACKAAREATRNYRAAHPDLDWSGYPA